MELISIGLVSDDGREFYAELNDFPRDACNPFVVEHVLPLLGKSPERMFTRDHLASALLTWLLQFENEGVTLSYDYMGDVALLRELLGTQMPLWLRIENVDRNIDPEAFDNCLKVSNKPQHHALYDAQAMRAAFRPGKPRSLLDAVMFPKSR